MRATNALLDEARGLGERDVLPLEAVLARRLDVSRSAVRSALDRLVELGVSKRDGRRYTVRRRPRKSDYYVAGEVESRGDLVERRFMEMALSGQIAPGGRLSEADLARHIGVSTASVREFLIGFSRYGLLHKGERGGWRFGAFDQSFGRELAEIRRLFELDAIGRFAALPDDDPAWSRVDEFLRLHAQVRDTQAQDPRDFSELDRRFHRFLMEPLHNRFANGFYDIIAFVFHYHYQWSTADRVARNEVALGEHEAVLHALAGRDIPAAERALEAHLETSVRTLFASATNPARKPIRDIELGTKRRPTLIDRSKDTFKFVTRESKLKSL